MSTTTPSGRIVLVHGFTQTAASWQPIAGLLQDRLRPEPEVITVDAPGHGTRHDVHLDLPAGADLLADQYGRATYIGYSMGGRLCLHLALQHPELVERLVLLGATPGIENDVQRADRRAADEELAADLERTGVEEFLERWLAQPLFARLRPTIAEMDERLTNTAEGLAASLRLAGTGTQQPLWDRLGEIRVPVLVLAGQHDQKFAEIGRRMADELPDATFTTVRDAGHAAHLEQPVRTGEIITGWLSRRAPLPG
ncbi:MAG: alpha/beta fold hydrolase [Ilumatobacter sp.]|nr:MAG: alpha/beta fold hydrolase [Ilumatobacter sp.]